MDITLIRTTKHGLESFQIKVMGVVIAEFLSEAAARTYFMKWVQKHAHLLDNEII